MKYSRTFKKVGRMAYKSSGYKNPMKKGRLSSSRVINQIPKMLKDISIVKGMLNAEKKRLEVTSPQTFTIGQVNGNNSGHYLVDLTPQPSQGVGFNQKTGNSFKWTSSYLDMQFSTPLTNISGQTLKIEIVKVVGLPYSSVNDILNKYIEPTSFISGSVYDLYSPRDPDYFKNFVVLKRRFVKIKNDDITNETVVKRVQLGLKLKNHHVRTNDNDPTLTMGQVFMIITADQGNCNPSTVSTLTGIPNGTANTGIFLRYEYTHYYYDN